jgi:hypothetical protein
VFTDNQILEIKYIYYINSISKDYGDTLAKQNIGRQHNATVIATGAMHSLELPIEEF